MTAEPRPSFDPQWRPWALVLALALLGVVLALIFRPDSPAGSKPSVPTGESLPPSPVPGSGRLETPPGDDLLAAYASEAGSGEEDLRRLGQVLGNFRLLHKGLDARHLATNAELAAALRGELPGTRPMVSAEAPVFDDEGRLVDRWGSPLIVHPVGAERLELRSAGPDRQAWTDDDLVRWADGRIARGRGELDGL
jgi:hypothetical protein